MPVNLNFILPRIWRVIKSRSKIKWKSFLLCYKKSGDLNKQNSYFIFSSHSLAKNVTTCLVYFIGGACRLIIYLVFLHTPVAYIYSIIFIKWVAQYLKQLQHSFLLLFASLAPMPNQLRLKSALEISLNNHLSQAFR